MRGTGNSILNFIPLMFISLIYFFVGIWLTRKKGKTQSVHYISCCIPFWNLFYVVWLISLTNIDIVKRIDSIEETLKEVLGQRKPYDPASAKWKCQCGQVNDMEAANCPVCRTKRDFILERMRAK
jgi:hypothetical protein